MLCFVPRRVLGLLFFFLWFFGVLVDPVFQLVGFVLLFDFEKMKAGAAHTGGRQVDARANMFLPTSRATASEWNEYPMRGVGLITGENFASE